MRRIITGFNRPNLALEVFYTPDLSNKLKLLTEFLKSAEGAGIIYAGTRRDTEEVAAFIDETLEITVRYYHAGLETETRNEIQDAFISGDLPLIVATNAFGMGIDRPDVRFVLHYSIPGSMEAYYQEAGRAGRDGLPARAVLFYSPRDSALHEYFIENDSPDANELRATHQALGTFSIIPPQNEQRTSVFRLDDLTGHTGLPEIKTRVALEQLEAAGALARLPDEAGGLICIQPRMLSENALQKIAGQVEAHRKHKRAMLAKMVQYAETNDCRRSLILNHFGDTGSTDAPICCDNCLSRAEIEEAESRPAETQSERAALIVLETISRVNLGKQKIAKLLRGSKARDITRYTRHPNYGKFAALQMGEIEALIDQLLQAGYIKSIGSRLPTLGLTPKGQNALKARSAIQVNLRRVTQSASRRKKAEQEAGGTLALTGQLLESGLTPSQIAAERGLSESTIYTHLARLIIAGKANVDAVVPADQQQLIRAAIRAVGSAEYLFPIKERLPDSIGYGPIRCVVEAWKIENGITDQNLIRSIILECVQSLPGELSRSGAAKILVGSSSSRIEQFCSHPLYNKLAGHSRADVLAVIDAMLQEGLLIQDEDRHLMIPNQDARQSQTINAAAFSPGLFEHLRAWRSEKARTIKKPAYVIFPDKALRGIASVQPQTCPELLAIHGIGAFKVEQYGEEVLALVANYIDSQQANGPADPITTFLSRPHPRPLKGPWLAGWALDFHSRFEGHDQVRGIIGDLVYRYKYEGQRHLATELACFWTELLARHPELPKSQAIIPIPPSTQREFDPVTQLARALAGQLNIPVLTGALVKTRQTRPQKELKSLSAKRANVAEAFALRTNVAGKHLLLVDDLYDSGATLCEAARILSHDRPASIVVLTLTKTIHADQ
jgi:superfamily II DNA helicase RecQ